MLTPVAAIASATRRSEAHALEPLRPIAHASPSAPPSPASVSVDPLRRQTPKVGAVCGKAARTDLCGGPGAIRVPTATAHDRLPEWWSAARRAALNRRGHTIWLFAGSTDGGRAIAAWLSVIHSARLHEVEPFAYVSDVLLKLAAYRDMPAERKAGEGEALLRGLMPEEWIKANPTARLALAR